MFGLGLGRCCKGRICIAQVAYVSLRWGFVWIDDDAESSLDLRVGVAASEDEIRELRGRVEIKFGVLGRR